MFSAGSFEGIFVYVENAANTRVRPPILPQNISTISIILENNPKPGVMPRVRPTVPIAEAVSNRQVRIGSPSAILIAIPPDKNNTRYIKSIATAFLTVSKEMRLPKHCGSAFLRNTD